MGISCHRLTPGTQPGFVLIAPHLCMQARQGDRIAEQVQPCGAVELFGPYVQRGTYSIGTHPLDRLGLTVARGGQRAGQGVLARIKAFVVPARLSYDLLLSRRWTSRVKAVEDHSANTLTIQGSDGIRHLVHGRTDVAPSTSQDNGVVSSFVGNGAGSGELLGLEDELAELT